MSSNEPIADQWRRAALEAQDAENAASLLEDTKSAIFAQKVLACGDMAVNRAETLVRGSRDWLDHVKQIAKARDAANRKKIEAEYLKMRYWDTASEAANERVMARL